LAERWEGLTLRAIEPLPALTDWPAALASPYLERKLDELIPSAALRVVLTERERPSEDLLNGLLDSSDTLQMRSDGKPEAQAGVSASHAGNLTLAVAGVGTVGCDIELVAERTQSAWRDLLGGERFELARLIARECGETLASAATRAWTALEALKKCGAPTAQAPLSFEKANAGWITLTSGEFAVVTWIASVDGEPVSVAFAHAKGLATRRPAALAYSYRHVVGFGDTNVVGNVYFVNYLEWQGRCREMFLRDKAPSVLEDLKNGLALVTTKCSCNYFAELAAFDEVRLDMRLTGIVDSQIGFAFEYWRCGEHGDELVARGEQEVACVRTQDGRRTPTEAPAAFRDALRAYGAISGGH
jgi:acyl-CoA thioesterase FadM